MNREAEKIGWTKEVFREDSRRWWSRAELRGETCASSGSLPPDNFRRGSRARPQNAEFLAQLPPNLQHSSPSLLTSTSSTRILRGNERVLFADTRDRALRPAWCCGGNTSSCIITHKTLPASYISHNANASQPYRRATEINHSLAVPSRR